MREFFLQSFFPENSSHIFVETIDKVAGSQKSRHSPHLIFIFKDPSGPVTLSLIKIIKSRDIYSLILHFSGALMEYAVILLLLKKRRKPRRTIDEGRKLKLTLPFNLKTKINVTFQPKN